jgi:hypothetical protein
MISEAEKNKFKRLIINWSVLELVKKWQKNK